MKQFESKEIIKLLNILIGETEAIGETYEDERRLANLQKLIEVTDWCLDGIQYAMFSGVDRPEYSMRLISEQARNVLNDYKVWIGDVLYE